MSQERSGHRVLVAEDEYFLAGEIEYALVRAGADVIGPPGNVEHALRQVEANGFDLAVLDINLGRDLAYPIADALNE